ncbi:MAG: methyltransferase domain-containing protein [Hyphomicrobiaceae bacterium]|nr:methyltransferase domain-containing protein [Hyphomicrobiaceae bacterium]
MKVPYEPIVEAARTYYNSPDADTFYAEIWGGEDIHIGIYARPDEPIADASRRTVERLADLLGAVPADARILDIGSGFGGAARYLARRFGCEVVALNLSERENERCEALNSAAGLDHLIDVVDGSFEDIPLADGSVDVVWSQDAILHSGQRGKVVSEVARVLKPEGRFVFTDIMASGRCGPEALAPVLARIHLDTLGSVPFYQAAGAANGLAMTGWHDLSKELPVHYARVAAELAGNREALAGRVSAAYIDRMLTGLHHWVDAGRAGCLTWGMLELRKHG